MIIESMKMEVQVRSPASGIVQSLTGAKGQVVRGRPTPWSYHAMIPDLLEIATIHAAYRAGTLTPVQLVTELLERIDGLCG